MSALLDPEPLDAPIIDVALAECADDAERVAFLRSQNDLLRAGNVSAHKLIDRAIITLREHGLHAEADDIERLASPF